VVNENIYNWLQMHIYEHNHLALDCFYAAVIVIMLGFVIFAVIHIVLLAEHLPSANAQSMTGPLPYQVAINQSLAEAAVMTANTVIQWVPTASLFASVNTAMQYAIGNMSLVYGGANRTLFLNASYSNGYCSVGPYQSFIANQTLTLEFLCCHLQKLRSPGLLLTLAQMSAAYFNHQSAGGPGDPTSLGLEYTAQVQQMATIGLIDTACLDDPTITVPQASVVRAISAAPVAGILLQSYTDILLNVVTLFTCTQGLSSICSINGTITPAQVPFPDLNFPDESFEAVCGYPALLAFDISRSTTGC